MFHRAHYLSSIISLSSQEKQSVSETGEHHKLVQQQRVALYRGLIRKITQNIPFDLVLYSLTICGNLCVNTGKHRIN